MATDAMTTEMAVNGDGGVPAPVDDAAALGVAPAGEVSAEVKAQFSSPEEVAATMPAPTPLAEEATAAAETIQHAQEPASLGEDVVGESATEKKRRRRGWTEEEEKRLREGVAQHGAGQWAKIRDSYGFKSEHEGEGRTCVNLKDKWRNLNRPPRPEKPPKPEQEKRPPRKKKPRTPKKRRDGDDLVDSNESSSSPPPAWIKAAAAWCAANLVKTDKGKVHVSTLRTKFSNSPDFFPSKESFADDETELENLKFDLENPKTEASKKFRSDALEPYVTADAIRQNCFIGGLNQLGVFGWCIDGDVPSPPARAPLHKDGTEDLPEDDNHEGPPKKRHKRKLDDADDNEHDKQPDVDHETTPGVLVPPVLSEPAVASI